MNKNEEQWRAEHGFPTIREEELSGCLDVLRKIVLAASIPESFTFYTVWGIKNEPDEEQRRAYAKGLIDDLETAIDCVKRELAAELLREISLENLHSWEDSNEDSNGQ